MGVWMQLKGQTDLFGQLPLSVFQGYKCSSAISGKKRFPVIFCKFVTCNNAMFVFSP